jgi:hypothetical protein
MLAAGMLSWTQSVQNGVRVCLQSPYCGADCSIGGPPPPPPTPEPASLILLGTGLAALAGFKKKKQLNQA